MTDALEDHKGTVRIRGRTITKFRFADDIDGLAEEEEDLANLDECFDKASTKLMTNNTSGINTEINQHRDQSEWTEAGNSHKLQRPGLSYN